MPLNVRPLGRLSRTQQAVVVLPFDTFAILQRLHIAFEITGDLLKHLREKLGKVLYIRIIPKWAAMVVPHMAKYVLPFCLGKCLEWVLHRVVVKVGEVDERAAEFVDGQRPTLQALCKFDHLTIRDLACLPIAGYRCPFLSSQRGVYESLTLPLVLN